MPEIEFGFFLLTVLLFLIAFLYSSVGLGGGSSYTALLAVFSLSHQVIPVVSLTLNLIVTTIGSFNFIRYGHARLRLILPFLLSSIPMAYLGGSLDLGQYVFLWILWVSLIFVVIRIYFFERINIRLELSLTNQIIISLVAGSILGFIAGVAGIGGGVYLIPLIIILGLGTAKEAAASGAIFVWVNSASGLFARAIHQPIHILDYLPLIIAVIAGGLLGSFFGAKRYSAKTIEKLLGVVIIIAVVLLGRKLLLSFI